MSQKRCKQRRRERPSGSSALRALTTGALALPGLASVVHADAPIERATASYRFSYYDEDDLGSSKVAPGSTTERYEIYSHQLNFAMPVGERMDVGVSLLHESMSGASPIFVQPGADGPVNVMSGATIEEDRTDFLATGNYYFDSGRVGASAGVSNENDYLAFNVGMDGEMGVFDKMTTLLSGVGASFDKIEPTDGQLLQFPNRPIEEKKQSYSAFVGVAQILTKAAVVQTSLTYRLSTGYLSDPYKEVLVGSSRVADARPGGHHQFAWLTRYRQHFEALNGTFHLDYALSVDSWDITANTLEAAWYQTLFDSFQLSPHVRYYTQSQAEFYAPFFQGTNTSLHRSSDYRLSPFGAISYGVRGKVDFVGWWKTNWQAVLSYERYMSDGDFAIGKVGTESPGLVDYDVIAFRVTGRF